MDNKKIRVAITHGDTNGIGYELIFKAFADPEMLELCTPVIYGSPKVASYHRKALASETPFTIISSTDDIRDGKLNLLTCFDEEVKVELGVPTEEAAAAGAKALKKAIEDQKEGRFDTLVLAPVVQNAEVKRQGLVVLMDPNLRIALANADSTMKEAVGKVTKENILKKADIFFSLLKRDLRIGNPRVAVLALNPNADGTEETEAILPAIKELTEKGKQAFGPYPAADFFGSGKYQVFDGILAMYHDQGAIPFRTLSSPDSIVCVAGLPVPCTMPLDATCHENAGKGVADENSFRQAIYTAIDICRNRRNFDEPLANPLPKLFHEKRDDSEKVRFSVPKKQENAPTEDESQE
ncbi:MAG: 4-hydroxythreonine-4-phosphate dehydrogenase PdxA [Prevotella sp.]|nr:4-hydroxythreonine-4-phosphate dehydrogenase PdxA [Prevotella sp.]